MGTVSFKLEGDEAKAVAAFLKTERAAKKVERGLDRMGRKGKQTGTAFGRMSKVMDSDLGRMVTGWATVGTAVMGVSRGLQIVLADMKRIDEQNKQTVLSLTGQIAGAGDMGQADRIRKFIATQIKHTGVGVAEGGGIYSATRGAAPGMGLDRILELTRASAGAKRAGFLGDNLTGFATTAGEIAKLAPQKTTGDVMDLTTYVKQLEGKYTKQVVRTGMGVVSQFVASGAGTIEQGLGLVLASVTSGQKATGAQLVVQKLREQRKISEPKFGETATDKKTRAFYAASPTERLRMLRTDRDVRSGVMGTQAGVVEALLKQDPAKLAAGAKKAQREDAFTSEQTKTMKNKQFADEMVNFEESAAAERKEFTEDRGRGMRSARFQAESMRKSGTWVVARKWNEFLDYMTGGSAYGEAGMDRAGDAMRQDIQNSAENLNKATDNINKATDRALDAQRKTANVNAHVENSEFTGN